MVNVDFTLKRRDGQPDPSLTEQRRSCVLEPGNANCYIDLLSALRRLNHRRGIQVTLPRVLMIAPDSPEGLAELLWRHIQHQDWRNATNAGQKLILLEPSRVRELTLLGWARAKNGDGAQANQILTCAEAVAPRDGWVHHTAATVHFLLGNFKAAEIASNRAIGTGFNPGETWFLLARSYRAQDRAEECKTAVAKAISHDPKIQARWKILDYTVSMTEFT